MAKRDTHKTDRNKLIKQMSAELRTILPKVLKDTGISSEASLNAKIGHKTDKFIDLKNEVIISPDRYKMLWMHGLQKNRSKNGYPNTFDDLYDILKKSEETKKYLDLFLSRSYLKHFDELYKLRPKVEEAEIWIGQNNADFGLLVSPRFSSKIEDWENDKSEIRHFKPKYWTIGHVLETGLVIPKKNKKQKFNTIQEYLDFFENVLVRSSGSVHQIEIASRYSIYVQNHAEALDIPLLIPELRYNGREQKHKYRLDFCVIDYSTMDKVGFEFSPWSSHGNLKGTKTKTQIEINKEALENFEKDTQKQKEYFETHGIYTLIFTDSDFKDYELLFNKIKSYLTAKHKAAPINLGYIYNFFD